MKKLLMKEIRLALHPTCFIFLALSAMLLIPNYPYYVVFFYTGLALFFTCLSGRENNDIFYMMLLPVRKRDIVKARFLTAVTLEVVQMIVAIPIAVLRNNLIPLGNQVGMDANVALFGISFIFFGVFNYVFFVRYYKKPDNVGKCFAVSSTIGFIFIGIAETLAHAVPFVKNCLDTKDPEYMSYKLITLAVGIVIYAVLTFAAYRKSAKTFEALDV